MKVEFFSKYKFPILVFCITCISQFYNRWARIETHISQIINNLEIKIFKYCYRSYISLVPNAQNIVIKQVIILYCVRNVPMETVSFHLSLPYSYQFVIQRKNICLCHESGSKDTFSFFKCTFKYSLLENCISVYWGMRI